MEVNWDKVNTITDDENLELVNRLLTKKRKEDLPHKYLICMINEYLTVEESITFKENVNYEISFKDYTDFQQKKKILKEFKGEKCFRYLLNLNERDEKLLRTIWNSYGR